RNTGKMPGIGGGVKVRVVGGDAVGKLVQVGFAENNSAGLFELGDNGGVVLGNEVLEDLRACRSANILCVNVVLQRNGNAVKRPAVAAAFASAGSEKLGFRFFGFSYAALGRTLTV